MVLQKNLAHKGLIEKYWVIHIDMIEMLVEYYHGENQSLVMTVLGGSWHVSSIEVIRFMDRMGNSLLNYGELNPKF